MEIHGESAIVRKEGENFLRQKNTGPANLI
jgi:hypothetical protein